MLAENLKNILVSSWTDDIAAASDCYRAAFKYIYISGQNYHSALISELRFLEMYLDFVEVLC